jgi:hypothetical protein
MSSQHLPDGSRSVFAFDRNEGRKEGCMLIVLLTRSLI